RGNAARRERGLHLSRLPERELRRARRNDERFRIAASARHDELPAKYATTAADSPGIVDSVASSATLMPCSFAAVPVTGPITAAGARRAASAPTALANAFAADADVNVTRST